MNFNLSRNRTLIIVTTLVGKILIHSTRIHTFLLYLLLFIGDVDDNGSGRNTVTFNPR